MELKTDEGTVVFVFLWHQSVFNFIENDLIKHRRLYIILKTNKM